MSSTVLIVDDSAMMRMMVRRALHAGGYRIREAGDGQEALEMLRAEPLPSLVICDVNMPRMNGIELLQKLSEQPELSVLRTLVLTTERQPELIRRARSLGALGWITKPFQDDQLLQAVRHLIAAEEVQ